MCRDNALPDVRMDSFPQKHTDASLCLAYFCLSLLQTPAIFIWPVAVSKNMFSGDMLICESFCLSVVDVETGVFQICKFKFCLFSPVSDMNHTHVRVSNHGSAKANITECVVSPRALLESEGPGGQASRCPSCFGS